MQRQEMQVLRDKHAKTEKGQKRGKGNVRTGVQD